MRLGVRRLSVAALATRWVKTRTFGSPVASGDLLTRCAVRLSSVASTTRGIRQKGASFLLEDGSPGCAGCDRLGLTNQEVGSAAAIGQPRMF